MKRTKEMFGISRVDQPEKKNHGWQIRIVVAGKLRGGSPRYFPDKLHGGKNKALKLAKARRDEILAGLPQEVKDRANREPRKIPKSGTKGVTHVLAPKGGYAYWQASWKEDGVRKLAKFSISRYGEDNALAFAIKYQGYRRKGQHDTAEKFLAKIQREHPGRGSGRPRKTKVEASTPAPVKAKKKAVKKSPETKADTPAINVDAMERGEIVLELQRRGIDFSAKSNKARLAGLLKRSLK